MNTWSGSHRDGGTVMMDMSFMKAGGGKHRRAECALVEQDLSSRFEEVESERDVKLARKGHARCVHTHFFPNDGLQIHSLFLH